MPASLDSLRREIDVIDDQMHDLLMGRASIVERIGALKVKDAQRVYIRPDREAAIVRRLVERHQGRIPASVVVRIWREMVAATSRLQGPFSVAVHAPGDAVPYWDLARDHYGSCTRMDRHATPNAAIRAVVDGEATVAVLPLPHDGERDPWWPLLVDTGTRMLRVVARLPFIENADAREQVGALAVAQVDQEKTGDDVSLVAVESSADLSRKGLEQLFAAAGLPANGVAALRDEGDPDTSVHLVEITDFVGPGDGRTAGIATGAGETVRRIVALGGYAAPLGRRDTKPNG